MLTIAQFAMRLGESDRFAQGFALMSTSWAYGPYPNWRRAAPDFVAIKATLRDTPCEISSRLTRAYGNAHWAYGPGNAGKPKHIKLSSRLFPDHVEIGEDATLHKHQVHTFFHEVAHLVAACIHDREGHGALWQWCFNSFGFNPSTKIPPYGGEYIERTVARINEALIADAVESIDIDFDSILEEIELEREIEAIAANEEG